VNASTEDGLTISRFGALDHAELVAHGIAPSQVLIAGDELGPLGRSWPAATRTCS